MDILFIAAVLGAYALILWAINLHERANPGPRGLAAITRHEANSEISAMQRRYHQPRYEAWLGRLALVLLMIVLPIMMVFIVRLP